MKKIFPLFLVLLALAGNAMAKTERADYDVIPLPKEVKVNRSSQESPKECCQTH